MNSTTSKFISTEKLSAAHSDAMNIVRQVQKTIVELRAGQAVQIDNLVFSSLDGLLLANEANAKLPDFSSARLLISEHRARALGVEAEGPVLIAANAADTLETFEKMALAHPAEAITRPVEAFPAGSDALRLTSLANHAPAVLIYQPPISASASVTKETLDAYADARNETLIIRSRARVPVKGDIQTELIVFENAIGQSEIALKVGEPDESGPAVVRLHSACVTGDIFGSMRCDCGEQLREAIEKMDDLGGGYLLYLDQEGRGIGIGNKMRAYALQDRGLDTVDANRALGFDDDMRRYGVAAKMLGLIGIDQVRLLTNNPLKVESLNKLGVDVVERLEHQIRPNSHNADYLATKAKRSGHMLQYNK